MEETKMYSNLFRVAVLSAVLMLSGGCTRSASDAQQGKVVEAGNGKLTMTDMAGGNQHSHDVAADVPITCGGSPCGLADLKAGATVTVTTGTKEDKPQVTKIEAGATST
jgi:ABC-type molybdate transport system substrate-binding protein